MTTPKSELDLIVGVYKVSVPTSSTQGEYASDVDSLAFEPTPVTPATVDLGLLAQAKAALASKNNPVVKKP